MSGPHYRGVALQTPTTIVANLYVTNPSGLVAGEAPYGATAGGVDLRGDGTAANAGIVSFAGSDNGVSITGVAGTGSIAGSGIAVPLGPPTDLTALASPGGAVVQSGTTVVAKYYHTVILNSPALQNPATVGYGGLIHAYTGDGVLGTAGFA